MNCYGVRLNIFVMVCLMLVLHRNTVGQLVRAQRRDILLAAAAAEVEEDKQALGAGGNLYELFKRRLAKIQTELGHEDVSSAIAAGTSQRIAGGNPQGQLRQRLATTRQEIARHDLVNHKAAAYEVHQCSGGGGGGGATAAAKRSTTIDNCMYEELKRRVDRFNNNLLMNPSEALQTRVDELRHENAAKRSTVRECMYEEYKKRLDKIGNDLSWDGEKLFDRSGRSFPLTKEAYEDYVQRMRIIGEAFYPAVAVEQSPAVAVERTRQRYVEERDVDETVSSDNDNDGAAIGEEPVVSYGVELGSSYPAVLTKAFETNMSPSSANLSPGNLLASVAKQMNTSTLELAKKLTSITDKDTDAMSQDPKLTATLQKYITQTVGVSSSSAAQSTVAPKADVPASDMEKGRPARLPKASGSIAKGKKPRTSSNTTVEEECEEEDAMNGTISQDQIATILEKVLTKLESIEAAKANASRANASGLSPDGAPCELLGSWNSLGMGLRFDISLGKVTERQLSQAEEGNKLLAFVVDNTVPPKCKKGPVDTDWKFMGSAMQQLGGPFYMYAQRRDDKLLATFAGYCRTCGGMDTIFGSWSFLHPSKDCEDISTAIMTKRDIFRRYKMQAKRKQHLQEIMYQGSKIGKTETCSSSGGGAGGDGDTKTN